MSEEKKDQIPTSSRKVGNHCFNQCGVLSVDRPDPYLVLWTPGAPHGRRKTRTVKNTYRPVWDQRFDFVLDPQHDTELSELVFILSCHRVHLMDRGAAVDQVLGKVRVDISELPLDKELYQELRFPHLRHLIVVCSFHVQTDERYITDSARPMYTNLYIQNRGYSVNCRVNSSTSPDLRLSCDLSEEENNFLDRRRVRVKEALETYLGGEQAPRNVEEVPRVAVLGSGGGFRAMVGFSSVLKTLHEMGVFPCVTYLASLSGSSWYLSDLYSHPEFPTKSPGDLQLELQRKVTGGWKKVLCPKRMFRYLKAIRHKYKTGQPVSFTDLFGHMVGDLLLGERKTCTLSEQSGKLTRGELPLPMYTCLQVKKDVSARVYQVRSGGPCTRSSPDSLANALVVLSSTAEDGEIEVRILGRSRPENRRCNVGAQHFFDVAPKDRQQMGRTDVTMLRYGDTKRRYSVPSKPYAVVLRCCDTAIPSVATLCRPKPYAVVLRDGVTLRRSWLWCWQDWLEFTPYEVGFSKHGASMKPPLFGNKLYLGRVTTPYKELPLHYLQGVWGSAYTIFFRRVIESGRRDALNPQQEDADDDSRLLKAGRTFKNHLSSRDDPKDPTSSSEGTTEGDEDSEVCTSSETETSSRQDLEELRPQVCTYLRTQEKANDVTLLSLIMARCLHSTKKLRRGRKWNFRRRLSRARSARKKRKRHRTFWQMVLSKLLRGRLLDSRSGRAGVVFNPVRGLKFCSPCAPYVGNPATTTPDDDAALKETAKIRASSPRVSCLVADVDFQGFYEPLTAHTKKLYLVDSGLTFNLPFPALLRPQRDVDIFLAFEFSNRAEDESSPFGVGDRKLFHPHQWLSTPSFLIAYPHFRSYLLQVVQQTASLRWGRKDCEISAELLLAEKWARLRNASFPPVSQQVEEFLKHPLRECYLFEDTEDPCCPVILFFVLINKCFRTHKDVDVLRTTKEEKDFSDFEIFDDPADPFSSFNFRYSQLQFDRLTRLVEFNTRLYEPMIRRQMEGAVLKKRQLLDKSADH
uniref:Phospholipase A2 n=1 Tax=Timema californicum TaxID=61474 RepID=A0A7R9P663_TIMCA|nr:unnamed protein product [Timema californicum]